MSIMVHEMVGGLDPGAKPLYTEKIEHPPPPPEG